MNPRAVFASDFLISAFLLAIKSKARNFSAILLADFYLLSAWGIPEADIKLARDSYDKFVADFFADKDLSAQIDASIARIVQGLANHETQRQMLFIQLTSLACLDADIDEAEFRYLKWFRDSLDFKPSEADRLYNSGIQAQNALMTFVQSWSDGK